MASNDDEDIVCKPGESIGTQMRDLFLWRAGDCEVFASKQIQSALSPLVIHIFCPFIIKSSAFLTALVFMSN